MIAVRLIGGLGNQMFQYACGRALARQFDQKLVLDLRGFGEQTLRRFSLDHYKIKAEVGNDALLPTIPQIRSPLVRLFPRWYRPAGLRIIRDYHYGTYDPSLFTNGVNLYLDGYWQTERYFARVAETIKTELQMKEPLDSENQRLVERIYQQPSVSVHVRRTDYINNSFYAQCTLAYYQRGIDYLKERSSNLQMFVFSDDPDWVRQQLQTGLPTTYVTHNLGMADDKDLALMSQCRHHIIANSSFSWWGAWLGTSADGIVIAPNTWYTDSSKDTRDLIPPGWITMPL